MNGHLRSFAPLVLFAACVLGSAQAQPTIQPTVDITQVPVAAQFSAHFDANAATEAYMAMIPPQATARSNASFNSSRVMTSMSQPTSFEARRTFWPRFPIASDN